MRVYFVLICDNWNHNRMPQLSFVFMNIDYDINNYYKYAGKKYWWKCKNLICLAINVLGSLVDD